MLEIGCVAKFATFEVVHLKIVLVVDSFGESETCAIFCELQQGCANFDENRAGCALNNIVTLLQP